MANWHIQILYQVSSQFKIPFKWLFHVSNVYWQLYASKNHVTIQFKNKIDIDLQIADPRYSSYLWLQERTTWEKIKRHHQLFCYFWDLVTPFPFDHPAQLHLLRCKLKREKIEARCWTLVPLWLYLRVTPSTEDAVLNLWSFVSFRELIFLSEQQQQA